MVQKSAYLRLGLAADAVVVAVEVRRVTWVALVDGVRACGASRITVLVVHLGIRCCRTDGRCPANDGGGDEDTKHVHPVVIFNFRQTVQKIAWTSIDTVGRLLSKGIRGFPTLLRPVACVEPR